MDIFEKSLALMEEHLNSVSDEQFLKDHLRHEKNRGAFIDECFLCLEDTMYSVETSEPVTSIKSKDYCWVPSDNSLVTWSSSPSANDNEYNRAA